MSENSQSEQMGLSLNATMSKENNSESRQWKSYISRTLFLFRINGTWKPLGFKNKFVVFFLRFNIYLMAITNVFMFIQNLITLVLSEDNLQDYLETVLFTNFYFTISFLELYCYYQQKKFDHLFDLFENCYQKGLEICGEVVFRKRWTGKEVTLKRFTILWTSGWIFIIVFFCGYPRYISYTIDLGNNKTTIFSPTANRWYFISYEQSPLIREIWYYFEVYLIVFLIYVEMIVDVLVNSILIYITANVENLCDAISSLPVDVEVSEISLFKIKLNHSSIGCLRSLRVYTYHNFAP